MHVVSADRRADAAYMQGGDRERRRRGYIATTAARVVPLLTLLTLRSPSGYYEAIAF